MVGPATYSALSFLARGPRMLVDVANHIGDGAEVIILRMVHRHQVALTWALPGRKGRALRILPRGLLVIRDPGMILSTVVAMDTGPL
jgi:hypothetical protein